MIKNVLEEAGRYHDVVKILNDIISKNEDWNYPVDHFITNDGEPRHSVNGKDVKEEARNLLKFVVGRNIKLTIRDCWNLWNYIHSYTDMLLHNYAVSVSHRNYPKIDMDVIRNYEILDNLIINLDDSDNWTIPIGWKKVKEGRSIGKYINLEEFSNLLDKDGRGAFNKRQLCDILYEHDDLIIEPVIEFDSDRTKTIPIGDIISNIRYVDYVTIHRNGIVTPIKTEDWFEISLLEGKIYIEFYI